MHIRSKRFLATIGAIAFGAGALPMSSAVTAVSVGNYVTPFRNVDKQIVSDVAVNRTTGEVYAAGYTFTAPTATNPISNVPARVATGFLSKLNLSGTPLWTKQTGRSLRSSHGSSIAFDGSGNIYMATVERSELANGVTFDIVVEKWTSNGTRVWQKILGGDSDNFYATIAVNAQGVYVAYNSNNVQIGGIGGVDTVISRLDPATGNTLRQRLIGSLGSDSPRGISITNTGDVVIAGTTNGRIYGARLLGRVDEDYFLAQFSSDLGLLKLGRQWGTRDNDRASDIVALADGGFAVSGMTAGQPIGTTNRGGIDATLIKIGSSGNELWTILIGSAADEVTAGLEVSPATGNIVVVGSTGGVTFGASAGECDVIGATFTTGGSLVGSKQFGTSKCDAPTSLALRSDGSPVIGGWTSGTFDSTSANDIDGFVVSAGTDIPNITQFVGTLTSLTPFLLPNPFPLLANASEQNAEVGAPISATPTPLCNEATSRTVKWRREVATCGGLAIKRGTTTKIRLSTKNAAGVCSLSPRKRLKLNAPGTCKVKIRATQKNGSTKAVWLTYKVS